MTKLHFALLLNDTPMPEVLQDAGDYYQQYTYVFGTAAKNKDVSITWDAFDVVHEQKYPTDLEKYDAIVLTGSKYNAHDNDEWILKLVGFVQTLLRDHKNIKLVGFCFGHQIMLRAAGGKTGRNSAGWEVGLSYIHLNEKGKEYFKTDKETLRIYQFHQDHVYELADGFTTLGYTNNNTANQITVSKDGQCITIQGHPEFSRNTMKTMIQRRKETGILPGPFADTCLDLIESSPPDMESVWFVEKVLDFVQSPLIK